MRATSHSTASRSLRETDGIATRPPTRATSSGESSMSLGGIHDLLEGPEVPSMRLQEIGSAVRPKEHDLDIRVGDRVGDQRSPVRPDAIGLGQRVRVLLADLAPGAVVDDEEVSHRPDATEQTPSISGTISVPASRRAAPIASAAAF